MHDIVTFFYKDTILGSKTLHKKMENTPKYKEKHPQKIKYAFFALNLDKFTPDSYNSKDISLKQVTSH